MAVMKECHYCERSGVEFKEDSLWGETIFVCADSAACKEAIRVNDRAMMDRLIKSFREA
jgi:hypothetical protein